MKFSEMTYTRPDPAASKQRLSALTAELKAAKSYEEARKVFLSQQELMSHISTAATLASIRHSIDTRDKFYDGEEKFWNNFNPELEEYNQAWTAAMLESPFRADFEKEYGDLMFVNAEIALKTFSPAIIPELQQENDLTQEYEKLLASAQIPFEGKVYTLSQLSPFKTCADDEKRLAAWKAEGQWYKDNQAKFDELYDKLVHLRDAMGKKLGYEGYTTLGYYRMGRNCYTKADVEKFRAAVVKYIVPLADSIYREQAGRLGKQYPMNAADNALMFRSGNPRPAGDADAILKQGKKFYEELSPETGVFFNKMLDDQLMDVLSTPGKAGGGYCTSLGDYEMPFIFANFNGTQHDVEVVTHEAGHAFAAYMNRDRIPYSYVWPSMEACEVHSMSMEFFAWRGRCFSRGCPQVPLQPSGGCADLHPLRHNGGPFPAHRLRASRADPGPAPRGMAKSWLPSISPGCVWTARSRSTARVSTGSARCTFIRARSTTSTTVWPRPSACSLGDAAKGPRRCVEPLHGLHEAGRQPHLHRTAEKRRPVHAV